MLNEDSGETDSVRINSEETEEEFEWFESSTMTTDTYFCYVNNTRETIEAGDQIFFCYGSRNNIDLLLNYGFCFPGNRYDSYELQLRLDIPIKDDFFAPDFVDLESTSC